MARMVGPLVVLICALALAGCSSVFGVTDSYGNTYGDYYNPGQNYQGQLALCEQETAAPDIPPPTRPYRMRCCMYRHGVPIDHPQSCTA
jgi:hypothetical protein